MSRKKQTHRKLGDAVEIMDRNKLQMKPTMTTIGGDLWKNKRFYIHFWWHHHFFALISVCLAFVTFVRSVGRSVGPSFVRSLLVPSIVVFSAKTLFHFSDVIPTNIPIFLLFAFSPLSCATMFAQFVHIFLIISSFTFSQFFFSSVCTVFSVFGENVDVSFRKAQVRFCRVSTWAWLWMW